MFFHTMQLKKDLALFLIFLRLLSLQLSSARVCLDRDVGSFHVDKCSINRNRIEWLLGHDSYKIIFKEFDLYLL